MEPARDALIVAVADYRDPKLRRLRAPAADAEALGRVLADEAIGGFNVQFGLDEDESTLTRRLARFFSNRRPEDLLLVHFSCHGIKDAGGELYMAASDTETDLLSATGIPSRWLSEQIGQCRSKRIVVLLDCCFSGSFPFGMRVRAGEQLDVQQQLGGRGRAVVTASNAMEYSFEGDELSGTGQPSIFTQAVVEGLETGNADRDGDQLVSIDELYEYVYDRVREMNPHQSPTKLSSLEGPLYIARTSHQRPVEPAPLSQELLDLIHHPYPAARLGAVAELSRLITAPDESIAMAARLALEQMLEDDSRNVSARARSVLLREPLAVVPSQSGSPPVEEPLRESDAGVGPAPGPASGAIAVTPPSTAAARGRSLGNRLARVRGLDRRRLGMAVVGVATAAAGAVIGSLLSASLYRSGGSGANGTYIAAFALFMLPVAVGVVAFSALLRATPFSPPAAIASALLAVALASLAGLIHFNSEHSEHPHIYMAGVSAIIGACIGLAATLPSRRTRLVLACIGAGILAGAFAGRLRPLDYVAGSEGAWVAANALVVTVAAAPVCLIVAIWSVRPQAKVGRPQPTGAEPEPAAPSTG